MTNSIDSLFNISMNFVVEYIDLVESFVEFPELIGEKIFKKFASDSSASSNSIHDVLKKFAEAYKNMVLERLSLSKRLLILNEHFESIVIISRYVTELCVCSCSLGENHEIFCHISEFKRLKKLCLRDNSMNNSSIRILTLRIRMYGIGGKEIEYFDLADNHFTDDMIPWLLAFPKLSYLNLSGSKISNKGIEALASQHNLHHVFDLGQHEDITNEGWAIPLFDKWISEDIIRRERKEKKPFFKKIISAVMKPTLSLSSGISLIFKKLPLQMLSEPPAKKLKLSSLPSKEIEDDIFLQYL